MNTPRILVPDAELSPAEWLRRYALTKMKYGGEDKARLLELSMYIEETEHVRDVLGQQLDRIATIIKGPPEPGNVWGFDDLPELVQKLRKEAGYLDDTTTAPGTEGMH